MSERCKSHGQFLRGCSGAKVGSQLLHSLLGIAFLPPPKCKVLRRPRNAGRGQHTLGPRGARRAPAVRLYRPPLRPAEASSGQSEESRREKRLRLRADPSARLSRSLSAKWRGAKMPRRGAPGQQPRRRRRERWEGAGGVSR